MFPRVGTRALDGPGAAGHVQDRPGNPIPVVVFVQLRLADQVRPRGPALGPGLIERGRVVRIEEVDTGMCKLTKRAVAARKHGHAVPQRIEYGEAEALVERRIDRPADGLVQLTELLVGDDTQEANAPSSVASLEVHEAGEVT